MTVSTTVASVSYDGDGSTTAFATTFVFFTSADIEVIERVVATGVETTKTLTTDYTVSGGGTPTPATGTVTAVTAPAATVKWIIRRAVANTQTTSLPLAGELPSSSLEGMSDKSTMQIQQNTEELGRSIKFPKTDASTLDPTIPSSVDRASKFLAFDSSGNPIASTGPTGDSSIPVSSFIEGLLDDETASDARTTLGALGTSGSGASLTDVDLTGKKTLFVPASAMRPTVSNGCSFLTDVETTAGRPDMQVLDFVSSADRHAQFQIAFPKSWNEGTVTFQVYWTTTATDTNGVAWGLQGVAVSNDDTIDVAYGTAVVVTDDNISAAEDMLVTSESSAVTIAGTPAVGDMCFFRVFRDVSDGNDDMTEDARLIGVQLFFTTNAGNDT